MTDKVFVYVDKADLDRLQKDRDLAVSECNVLMGQITHLKSQQRSLPTTIDDIMAFADRLVPGMANWQRTVMRQMLEKGAQPLDLVRSAWRQGYIRGYCHADNGTEQEFEWTDDEWREAFPEEPGDNDPKRK